MAMDNVTRGPSMCAVAVEAARYIKNGMILGLGATPERGANYFIGFPQVLEGRCNDLVFTLLPTLQTPHISLNPKTFWKPHSDPKPSEPPQSLQLPRNPLYRP